MIEPGLRLPPGPPRSDRRLRLLSIHDANVQRLLGGLPSPLDDLARASSTYLGTPSEFSGTNSTLRSPGAVAAPWLFWETFDELDDDNFLRIAEGGACLLLASVLLDHLLDGQLPEPGGSTLLNKALTDHGVSAFLQVFPADSAFWSHYRRLSRQHVDGLAAELAGRADPRQFTYEAMEVMARGKVCPGVITIAGFTEAFGRTELLGPIERSMALAGVASQLVDDARDWKDDAQARHLTHFLSCLGSKEAWSPGSWPSVESFARQLESDPLETRHLRRAVSLLHQAIEQVHDVYCPHWTGYLHGKRLEADRMLSLALIRRLAESLGQGRGEGEGEREAGGRRHPISVVEPANLRPTSVKQACDRALSSLLAAQRFDGSWIDFDLPDAGPSDAWITAHVGLQLATLSRGWLDSAGTRSMEAATAFLKSKWRHGWGYNDQAPVDADSTAHGLLYFRATGTERPASTLRSLLAFQQPDGGFATYLRGSGGSIPDNWCQSHPDVTPMAIHALAATVRGGRDSAAVNRALSRFEADRVGAADWPAFWWGLRWYTAAAWSRTAIVLGPERIQFRWSDNLSVDLVGAPPLDAAWLLELATNTGRLDVARKVVDWIICQQLGDGLWPVHPVLRWTKAGFERPWEEGDSGSLYPDVFGVYSTATILNRLARFAELAAGRATHPTRAAELTPRLVEPSE